jgi:hypothetical protein
LYPMMIELFIAGYGAKGAMIEAADAPTTI